MNHTTRMRRAARGLTVSAATGVALLALAAPAVAAPAARADVDATQRQLILDKHNTTRAEVNVGPLSWDDRLAADAQAYAVKLAASGVRDHDRAELERLNEGENLAWGPTSITPASGTDLWIAEKPNYYKAKDRTTYGKANPEFKDFGHYTQVIWQGTTRVGCGTATGGGERVISCRYASPGNRTGQLPYPGADKAPLPGSGSTPPRPTGTDQAACAYNPGGRGGYGSSVDGLALDVRDWELDMTNAINAYRRANGVPELRYSRTLARPAMWASLDDFNRGRGPNDGRHLDSRGMDVPARVKYCSGYTGRIYELVYTSSAIPTSKWQVALDFWKKNSRAALLDRSYTTFSGVQMAYGNNDVDRNPTYYTLLLGDH